MATEVLAPATARSPALLRRGNGKLGPNLIWTFSLPARETCPGATDACRKACYAAKGRLAGAAIKGLYARNLVESRRRDFAATLAGEVRRGGARVVRLHVAGDFYSAAYVRKWIDVARRCPDCVFFGYTRSWRTLRIRAALREFAAEPNVDLWYSADSESGPPPRDPGVRTAWMLAAAEGPDSVPADVDLVFRVRHATPLKRAGGVLVCPYENGVPLKTPRITCDKCRICFPKIRRPRS